MVTWILHDDLVELGESSHEWAPIARDVAEAYEYPVDSLVLSSEGEILAHVATNADQGAAYVFVRPAGGWRVGAQAAKLVASDGAAGDQFGVSVAVSGDDVFVGSWNDDNTGLGGPGSVYVFTKPAGGWAGGT